MPAFLAPLLGALGKVAELAVKLLPAIAAFFAGKKVAEGQIAENNAQVKQKVEETGQKVRDDLRKEPVGDYIRKNDI